MGGLVRFIFFGNLFYGVCSVALSVEASLQLHLPLNNWLFYVLTFLVTVLYYNLAYITEKPSRVANPRSRWYAANFRLIRYVHNLLAIAFVGCLSLWLVRYGRSLADFPVKIWMILSVFPLVAILYYGFNHKSVGRVSLRDLGLLKPFVIGFSWAGLVTIFPVIYHHLRTGEPYNFTLLGTLLFVKNFMFISLLCILFDVKDYATDYNLRLKTLVVQLGLRKTIFYLILPLTFAGLGTFLGYGFTHGFSLGKILLNTLPFLALIAVAYSFRRRRSIFFYLVIIDGLMLVKAICGITAMVFF